MNKNFIFLDETESTNNYANQLLLTKAAAEGTVVMTHFQTKGKGQQGNSWESEPGKNLLASFILQPKFLKATHQFYLSKAVSLALTDLLTEENIEVSIKWPNDIYADNRKIAGILIENSIIGSNLNSVVVGIGLNLNQSVFISGAPNPVSLTQLTGKNYSVEIVAEKLWEKLEIRYNELQSNNLNAIDNAYLNRLFRYQDWAFYAKQGEFFEARITEIGQFGQLILEQKDGTKTEHLFKEVEFVI
jgi:BirA family biotin operon repressor/biotin-[acetyl-CoA-carboxylase] ligase